MKPSQSGKLWAGPRLSVTVMLLTGAFLIAGATRCTAAGYGASIVITQVGSYTAPFTPPLYDCGGTIAVDVDVMGDDSSDQVYVRDNLIGGCPDYCGELGAPTDDGNGGLLWSGYISLVAGANSLDAI